MTSNKEINLTSLIVDHSSITSHFHFNSYEKERVCLMKPFVLKEGKKCQNLNISPDSKPDNISKPQRSPLDNESLDISVSRKRLPSILDSPPEFDQEESTGCIVFLKKPKKTYTTGYNIQSSSPRPTEVQDSLAVERSKKENRAPDLNNEYKQFSFSDLTEDEKDGSPIRRDPLQFSLKEHIVIPPSPTVISGLRSESLEKGSPDSYK